MFEMGEHLLLSPSPLTDAYLLLSWGSTQHIETLTKICGSFIQVIPQDPDQPKKLA